LDGLLVIFWGIVLLSFVVVVHEFGHFIVARAFGVRVTEFMVGLPGPSIGFTHKGTRFGITALLFGGYARIAGMEPGDEDPLLADALAYVWRHGTCDATHLAAGLDITDPHAEDLLVILSGWGSITTPKGSLTGKTYLAPAIDGYQKGEARLVDDPVALLDEQRKGTYRALPCWKRLLILFAGPAFNLVLALIIFIGLFSIHGVYEASTTLYDVVAGSPAATAGIQAGDTIVQIDGVEIPDWETLVAVVDAHEPGDQVSVAYLHDGQRHDVSLVLTDNGQGHPALGIYAGSELVHMSLWESTKQTGTYFLLVLDAIGQLFNPATMAQTLDQSTSVVGIAYEAKAAADQGFLSFLLIIAAVSVSLGFMNLLPIAPLDGGKIVIEVIQRIRGRELSLKATNIINVIGIGFVMLLFMYLLFQDMFRYVLGG